MEMFKKIKREIIHIYNWVYQSDIVLPRLYEKEHKENKLQIMTADQTLEYILKSKCSVARFGEGELELCIDKERNLGFQMHSEKLTESLVSVLNKKNESLLVCIPYALNCIKGRTLHSRMFWYNWSRENEHRNKTFQLINKSGKSEYLFGDIQISRPWMHTQSAEYARRIFDKLKLIWGGRDIIIVEGEYTRLGVGNDLFTNTLSIKRVLCPPVNAFECYDHIRDEINKIWQNEMVILALGPTATVLASDLSEDGIQAIDLGHVDIEYEWYLQGEKTHSAVRGKFTNEADHDGDVEKCDDKAYNNQIVSVIRIE